MVEGPERNVDGPAIRHDGKTANPLDQRICKPFRSLGVLELARNIVHDVYEVSPRRGQIGNGVVALGAHVASRAAAMAARMSTSTSSAWNRSSVRAASRSAAASFS